MTRSTLCLSGPFFACLLVACGSDPSGNAGETDGTTGTTPGETGATDSASAGSESTSTAGETTTAGTTGTDTEGVDEGTSGEPSSVCVGLTEVGHGATVYELEGAQVDEGTCSEEPAACGGELVGTWNVVESCGFDTTPNPFADYCPGSILEPVSFEQSGSLTFEEGSTFSQAIVTTAAFDLTLDAQTCFDTSCAALGLILNSQPGLSGTCEGPDDACTCSIVSEDSEPVSGTYAVADDQLVLTSDGETGAPAPYCAATPRLDIWQPLYAQQVTMQACEDVSDCEAALGDLHERYVCANAGGLAGVPGPAFRLPAFRR